MARNLDNEYVVTEVPQDVQGTLETISIKHVGNHYRQPAPAGFRAVCFKRGAGICFSTGDNVTEKTEYLEDSALAALGRHFVFNSIRKRDDVDAVEICQPDVAQGGANPACIIQF